MVFWRDMGVNVEIDGGLLGLCWSVVLCWWNVAKNMSFPRPNRWILNDSIELRKHPYKWKTGE
jgi:hypothetical protein